MVKLYICIVYRLVLYAAPVISHIFGRKPVPSENRKGAVRAASYPHMAPLARALGPKTGSLRLRHAADVLRRYRLVILFMAVLVPALVWLVDSFVRERIWTVEVRMEELNTTHPQELEFGMASLPVKQPAQGNPAWFLQRSDFDNELRHFLADDNQVGGSALVTRMNQPGYLYMACRGQIEQTRNEDGTFTISISGRDREIHEEVANYLVPVLNKMAREKRRAQLTSLREQLREAKEQNHAQQEYGAEILVIHLMAQAQKPVIILMMIVMIK